LTWKNIADAEEREKAAKKQELDDAERLLVTRLHCHEHFTMHSLFADQSKGYH
jgi:hypothetical protein